MNIGVVEGFFGPAWPASARESYAAFLRQHGGEFYIYAPKQDQHLRKAWRADWDQEFLGFLAGLSALYRSKGLRFGVALSPFGLGETLKGEDAEVIVRKIGELAACGTDILGVFFDDMPSTENLAKVQAQVIALIRSHFKGEIVFCPSYYTFDPILEKVFGEMPPNYLEDIARLIPEDVAIAWTGPKVISPVIPREHLVQVNELLRRKPFMWENLFANDGPKNCKFLKLRAFSGREEKLDDLTEAWGLNMMNQPELSKITFLASVGVLKGGLSPEDAFATSLRALCTPELARFIQRERQRFFEKGLDQLDQESKEELGKELSSMTDPAAREIEAWLRGEYTVGSECLTD